MSRRPLELEREKEGREEKEGVGGEKCELVVPESCLVSLASHLSLPPNANNLRIRMSRISDHSAPDHSYHS